MAENVEQMAKKAESTIMRFVPAPVSCAVAYGLSAKMLQQLNLMNQVNALIPTSVKNAGQKEFDLNQIIKLLIGLGAIGVGVGAIYKGMKSNDVIEKIMGGATSGVAFAVAQNVLLGAPAK